MQELSLTGAFRNRYETPKFSGDTSTKSDSPIKQQHSNPWEKERPSNIDDFWMDNDREMSLIEE